MAPPSGLAPLLSTAKTAGWVLGTTGVVLTCFRLWDRCRSGRLWWDDCWAFISMLLIIVFMTAFGIYFESDPTKFSQSVKVAGYYFVTWSAKVSVLFTIIRLQYGRARLFLAFVSILFGVMWVILIAQLLRTCERNTDWKLLGPIPQCTLGFDVAIAQFVTAILSDVILIGAPLWMVYKSSGFNRAQKIRLSALFSTTFITTVVSMVHAGLILKVGGVPEGIGAILEASVSLIVANLSVIIAFFFRITTEDVPTPRERETPGIENIIQNRGTGPIFTKVNVSSLLRGGNFPENGISSTFISEDGKVRVRKDADEGDDHANPGGPSASKHRPLQGEQQGTSTQRFEETRAVSLGSIGYGSTEYATASAYHQPEASVA
ncbi:hypothetical protein D9611_004136 [Ephemerocybe angulata]|uniref:Rhodopsin domain-containing protein n=1 Tax=Ephemerocybe angulata TaxID=980116 RepID=A0A8H5BKP8_9AGAR|nr:hypothetical protein D9611_004136 [Tulosesus angulatus]